MRRIGLGHVLPRSRLPPVLHKDICEFTGAHAVAVIRTNVVIARILCVPCLLHHNHEIGVERLQHMLVRTGRIGISKLHCLALYRCPHTVRDNSVLREITAADHVARARGGNAHCTGLREKGLLVGVGHQLRAALRVRVGIVAVQLLILGKAVVCLLRVLIYLIGRHVEEALHTAELPHCLEEVHGAHHIGLIGLTRIAIGLSDQGLRREMKHTVRPCLPHGLFEAGKVADIRNGGMHLVL